MVNPRPARRAVVQPSRPARAGPRAAEARRARRAAGAAVRRARRAARQATTTSGQVDEAARARPAVTRGTATREGAPRAEAIPGAETAALRRWAAMQAKRTVERWEQVLARREVRAVPPEARLARREARAARQEVPVARLVRPLARARARAALPVAMARAAQVEVVPGLGRALVSATRAPRSMRTTTAAIWEPARFASSRPMTSMPSVVRTSMTGR